MLKAPIVYFGGKYRCAKVVWQLFGTDCVNYVEPFCGSMAILLARPSPFTGTETVNDWSCQLVNMWRAIAKSPEQLAAACVSPVAEVDNEARHYWLVSNADRLRNALGDPDYFELDAAVYFIKGINEWIGSGFCGKEGKWVWNKENGWHEVKGRGVNKQLPHLCRGVGVNKQLSHYVIGKGQYELRVAFLTDWLMALRDRICDTRITCGDWKRVLGPTPTRLGKTAVFLDPPYLGTEYVYGSTENIYKDVNKWALENGDNKLLKIIVCGRDTEHDSLLDAGWTKLVWDAVKGYAKSEKAKQAATTETLWCSPNCEPIEPQQATLF